MEIYIVIDKVWFEENRSKFAADAAEVGKYQITDASVQFDEVELGDISDGCLSISQQEKNKKLYVSLDYKPQAETIVELVEQEIDNIRGESLSKIIELVVKKLNKLKSLIESIRGL